MEYSIRELSQLSGVTTRTLRWYDEIGLLKPAYVAESGYRYYREAEVDRLQDILYYRELGVQETTAGSTDSVSQGYDLRGGKAGNGER